VQSLEGANITPLNENTDSFVDTKSISTIKYKKYRQDRGFKFGAK
jgi:hypothetical protein